MRVSSRLGPDLLLVASPRSSLGAPRHKLHNHGQVCSPWSLHTRGDHRDAAGWSSAVGTVVGTVMFYVGTVGTVVKDQGLWLHYNSSNGSYIKHNSSYNGSYALSIKYNSCWQCKSRQSCPSPPLTRLRLHNKWTAQISHSTEGAPLKREVGIVPTL